MLQSIKKFFDEKGQGIVEYALILAFVVAIAVALTNSSGLKDSVQGAFSDTADKIDAVKTSTTTSTTPSTTTSTTTE